MTLRELHLFAGAGGGILGGLLLGHHPVCAVEIDPYCRRVLRARQADGWLPADMEMHDDVTKFDGSAWRGRVDVVCGGFPCQDISVAGKGRGLSGERSGLWWHMHRIIREVGPRFCFVENSPALTSRGLDAVLGSLAEIGFNAEWCVLGADDVGAPHKRKRIWILGRNTNSPAAQTHGPICSRPHAEHRGDGAAVADTSSGQGDRRDGGIVGAALQGRPSLDASAGAGGQDVAYANSGRREQRNASERPDPVADTGSDDPNPDSWRREIQRIAEPARIASACGSKSDGLGTDGGQPNASNAADSDVSGRKQQREPEPAGSGHTRTELRSSQHGEAAPQPEVGRVADGMAGWLDRSATGSWQGAWETQPRVAPPPKNRTNMLHALGNGQVPQCAAIAFALLMERFKDIPRHVAEAQQVETP